MANSKDLSELTLATQFRRINKGVDVKQLQLQCGLSSTKFNELLTVHEVRAYCELSCKDCRYAYVCKHNADLVSYLLKFRSKGIKGLEYATGRV